MLATTQSPIIGMAEAHSLQRQAYDAVDANFKSTDIDRAAWKAVMMTATALMTQPVASDTDVAIIIGVATSWLNCVFEKLEDDAEVKSMAAGIETALGNAAFYLLSNTPDVGLSPPVAAFIEEMMHDAKVAGGRA